MRAYTTACAVAMTVALARPVLGQEDICRPATGSHEAKMFAILSVPIAFTGGGVPLPAHGITIGLEAASLPGVDSITATPTTCRAGKGAENTNPVPGIIRPRIAVAVSGFVIEGSWIPPVRVDGVKANLVGLAVSRPIAIGRRWSLGVRVHAVLGALHAPVVCDENAIKDDLSECYKGTVSNDRWAPNVYGVEAVVATPPGPVRVHGGLGFSRLQPRFQVDFTNSLGSRDRRKVEVDLNRAAIFGGVTYRIGPVDLAAEGYATLADAITVRFVLRTPLGG